MARQQPERLLSFFTAFLLRFSHFFRTFAIKNYDGRRF